MRKKILSVWGCLAAASAVAETPLLSEFVQGTVAESVPVRLEARMDSAVAGKVVTGKVAIPSPDGVSSREWDTSSAANGWTEVTDGDEKASLLVLNPPGYAVEGGRITANTSWSANAVHWVRNWVVVPSGVILTVKEGTIVKFGEQTGIKVEDGGTVDFQGKSDSRIVLTHFADDVYGGDSDFGKTNASYGAWSVTAVAGGTVNDTYTHVRYGKIESLPTISMPASVTAQRVEGKARIPVTLSGTRANRMSLHWRTIDGTAKYGTDFSKNEDEAIWSNTSVETVYFEIPLIKTTEDDEVKTFRVEVLSTEDVNPNPERLVTTVTIISGTSVPIAKCVESDESAAIRLENRKADAVGRALVHGVEQKASDPNSAAAAWDTTKEPEGWQTLTADESSAKVLVRNDAKVAIEGGRLTANTRWDSSAVHLVRNRVIVPAGVTLTIGEGAIVKFCEQTGIKVEDGGALVTEGKEKNRAVLTAIADDEFGGDSDLQESQPVNYSWSIETVGSGSVSDVYTYVQYGTVSTLPTISMPTSATAQRSDGKVRIPVTLSGTRANRMSIHWRAVDGTAKFGVDYSEKEGEAYWANTSTTTVYFEIPIIKENESEEVKTFDVELVSAEDINIDPLRLVTKVMIVSGSAVPVAKCAESEASAAVRLENRSAETVGHALVRGVELKAPAPAEAAATWDTTQEPEGWNTLTATSGEPPATAKVLVRNAADIAFEGGRLEASAKWTSDAVHIVRNMVVVPSGITLTVAEGTVVKFAEATGIKVEDGGKLSLEGKDKARSVLTSLADDEFGGDTDLVETNGVYGSWSVETVGSGEVSDVYTYIRYGTIAPLPTISMPVSATAQRTDGKVRIPVTFSGTRSNRVAIHWRTNDGTAKYGVDFPENAGEAVWANTSTTTVFLEIPITKECETDEVRTFQVELVSAEDINIDPSRLVTTVTIVSGAKVPMPTCAVSESSAAMRMEARSTNSLGRAAVVGTEWKAKDGGSRAEEWDTTPLGYGWQTLEDGHGTNAQVLALNDAKIAVEGGRLTANVSWESNVVHVVRNTVVVPSGITLTVLTNAVVKFCENTGVKVEVGGSLIVIGSKDEPAIFTPLADDTAGGDTDKRETPVRYGEYVIDVVSGGTFSDSYAAFRHIVVPAHATLSLPEKCEINESEKQVQIPVTLSGSRTTPFRAFWRVIDGTAKYPDDFPTRTGVVEWNSTSDGTRFITVPVNDDGEEEETENFTVELYDAQGANISASACACVVTVRDSTATAVPYPTCAESPASEAIRLDNRSEGMLGKAVVKGVEYRAAGTDVAATAWDTTVEPEGWQTLTASDIPALTAQVLVRNDAKIAVEGGRLTVSTVWDSNLVHLVRHTVVVPSGVTLSVTTNAVVKFCENTGVKVEAGGRFQLLGSLDENVYMTLANDDTVGGDTDKDEEREWMEGAATYSVDVVSGGTFTDMNSVIRGTTIGTFGYASVNAKTVVDATEGVVRIPVFVNGSRTTQFSVDWKTSDGLRGQLIWGNVNEGTKWVTLNVADCSEKFTFELCECRGINIDGAAKASEVSVFNNATPLAVCAESESSTAVRFENRADSTFGKSLCFDTEWKSVDGDSRAEAWDTTQEPNDWIDLGEGMKLLVRNDADLAVEGGRLMPTYDVVNTNGVDVTNWNYSVNWTSDKVHVVRNWVVVPSGMTLSIAAGTVVKFAEYTGFKVEAGGRLYVEGSVDAPVVYTAAADDTIGGDTDKREIEPQYGDYSINIISGGTYSDRNCAVRYATFSNLGTATLPAKAVANEKDGVVRVPMFINTSRTTAFCVDWRVASGTYATKGRLNWNNYSEGTKYIEIPLTPGTVKGEFDTFEIEMYESQGINVSTTERKCVVTVYPDKTFPEEIAFADPAESAAVRMENRAPLWSYGAEIVCGTELKSANGESRAEPWDTTQENEGWVEVSDGSEKLQLLVRNDESVAVEGGRMEASTVWTKDVVHIVRNWVVVPNGVTLTIAAGTVVKFCDETGIKVEAGGRLVSAGTASADVILTSINDDAVGGDTDSDDVEPEHGDYWINVVSGGTFTDTYTQMRYGESGTFGSVSIAPDVVAKKDGGIVRIPLTISASRTTPFSVDWVAHDGTAIYGEDYLCASGRIAWTSSSQGTRYLEIPLDRLSPTAEDEWFEVELITGLGINLNLNSTLCLVDLYDSRESLVGDNEGYAESAWSEFTTMDSDAGREPKFVVEDETLTYSTDWATNGAVSVVAIADAENNTKVLHDADAPAEGAFVWSPEGYEDGRYDLTHRITDDEGRTIKADYVTFIINRDVMTHGGRLTTDETWGADKVHLVKTTVYVPSGVTLTIAPDAIVKFMPGTEIVVEAGGLGICRGAIITHAYDDAMGGDTFFDGGDTIPSDGAYKLTGDWEDDATTQYHYVAPIEVGGTIRESQRWPGYKTYKVKSSITLQSGVTLDIEPGAVIKFGGGMSFTVNSGATLNAQGTRSAPIVFTSIKDDEFGGDTNGDGDSSIAMPGDWIKLGVNGGTANLSYAYILYSSKNSTTGAINMNGGKVVFNNGIIAHGLYDAVGVESGNFHMTNSVITDCLLAFRHWPRDPIVNCIVYDCGRLTQGGSQNFVNCIFSKITETWEAFGFPQGTAYRNCCFWNEGGSVLTGEGYQDAMTVCGKNGNIWGDPKFVDPENWDFRIAADSPCVDAGNGLFASNRDYYNQPRRNVATVTPTGVADAEGNYPDIGLYEVQPRFATSDIDLAMKTVSVPKAMSVGDVVEVSWRVSNLGTVNAEGPWSDKVEIISGSGEVTLLGTYLVKGGIAAGGERLVSSSFRVPSAAEGECRIRVTANYARDLYEGSQTANNVMYADANPVVSIPTAEMSAGEAARLRLIPGQSASYALDGIPAEGGAIALRLAEGVSCEALVSFGKLPTSYAHASAMTVLPDGRILISIPPNTNGETVYLSLIADGDVTNTGLIAELLEDYPAIYSVSKVVMPNIGKQSLTVTGVGLDEIAGLSLMTGDKVIVGESLRVANAGEASATFDLTGAKLGDYSVVGICGSGKEVLAPQQVSVILREGAKPNLEISLQAPTAIRANRWYEAIVTVKNTGDADAEIPIVALSGEGIEFRDPDGAEELYHGVIHLLVMPEDGLRCILAPNCEATTRCTFRLTGGQYELHARIIDAKDQTWDSLYGIGQTDDEKADYAELMDERFGSVENFVSETVSFAAGIAKANFRPKNALRLYETLIKNKLGNRTAVISGWLVSSETRMPVAGCSLGFISGLTNDIVYVTTDATGAFVAYDVPTGEVSVASADGCVKPTGKIVLGCEGIDGLVLIKRDVKPEAKEVPEIEFGPERNNLRILPFEGGLTCLWLDGGILCASSRDEAWANNVLLPGVKISAYDILALSENECAFVGVVEDENQSLIWFKISKQLGAVGLGPIFMSSVLRECQSVCITAIDENCVTVAYSVATKAGTAVYVADLSFDESNSKTVKLGSRLPMRAIGVNSSAAIVLPREITASIGIADVTVQIPIADNNTEHCCTLVTECSGGGNCKFGSDDWFSKWAAGLKINVGGSYESQSASRCSNFFLNGALGCNGCDDLQTWTSKNKYNIEIGVAKGFPIPFIHKLKGVDYNQLRNANFSFDVSGEVGGNITYSYERILNYAPSDNGRKLVNDYREMSGGYSVDGDIGVSFSIGKPEVLASKGRGRTKQEKSFFSMSSGLINAHLNGTLNFRWQDGVFTGIVGSGTISGSLYNLQVYATLVNDNGDIGWKWAWGLPTDEREHPHPLSLRASLKTGFVEHDGRSPVVMPATVGEYTYSPSSVSRLSDNDGFVFLRQDRRMGVVSTDVLKYDAKMDQIVPIAQPNMDIGSAQAVRFGDGSECVVFVASEHNLTGTADEALAAIGMSKLFIVRGDEGEWGSVQSIPIPENEYAGGFVVSQEGNDDKVVVYGATVITDDSVKREIRSVIITTDAVSVPQTVVGGIGSDLVSVDVAWNGGVPVVLCSFENDEAGDIIRYFKFNGESWIEDGPMASSIQALGLAKEPLCASEDVGGHNRLMSHTCDKSCKCGCQKKPPKPKPGCGCPSSCKCKGLCGANCKCGGGGKHNGPVPQSSDPNEMAGPDGKGNARCVRDGDWMNYTIYFENKAEATAAAQDVFVTLPKDSELDWTTFELGEIAFGENIDTGLSGKSKGECSYALPGTTWSVRTIVTHTDDAVKWHLRVIDPSTPDNYPEDVYAGFLPPNDSTGRGEGYLRYKVKVRNGATAGKIIGASAIIVFDDNPAIETDPAWSNTVSRLVAVSGKTGAGATIMVDPNWIKANLGESATDAQVAEALNKTGKNGIKVWANAALGLDPNDENDRFLVDAPQNDEAETVSVKTLKGALPESAWMPIKYRVDVDQDGSGAVTLGTAQDANEFGIDIGGDADPTGIYKVLAVFTDDEGAEIEEVPAANQIGVLRKAAANKREIVPVPWTKFAAGAEDIAVSNLVKTAGLTAGDKLYVYDDSAKRYATWELQSDKTWKPVKTVKMVNGKLEVQTADLPEVATVKRGSGVWLERQDTSKPIALVGQYEAVGATTVVAAGTAALPSWNLIASPAISNWNLNAICDGVGVKDRIIVPTGKEPRIYTRDAGNTKWGYITYEANDKGIVKPVRKEDDTLIAPGAGLWYISEGGAPVIKW